MVYLCVMQRRISLRCLGASHGQDHCVSGWEHEEEAGTQDRGDVLGRQGSG